MDKPIKHLFSKDDILERVTPITETGCWVWLGAIDKHGYGTLRRGKNYFAHRISFSVFHPDEEMNLILHKCNNPYCVNPDHLYSGTQKQNMLDKKMAGRVSRLFKNTFRRILTADDAREIQKRYDAGEGPKEIHKDYSFVSKSTVSACCTRQNWGDV